MNKYALIKNNIVENIIIWDGISFFQIKKNEKLISIDNIKVKIGWAYDELNNSFYEIIEE